MNPLANLALSIGETLVHEGGRLLFGIALGRAKELLGTPQPLGTRQLALNRALQMKAVDGALLAGPRTGKEYAKFTLKKGLPTDQRPRTLAVENEPHSVDDFDGAIKEGYGKGEKRLIHSGTGVIKVGGSCQLGKINVHESLTTISSPPSKISAIALPYGWPASYSQALSRKEPCCVESFTIPTEPPEWAES
jgi:hypothetical protein